jgi:hypothetical protein
MPTTGGTPIRLVNHDVYDLAADETHLYFVDGSGVNVAALDGSGPQGLSPHLGEPIATDGSRLYWISVPKLPDSPHLESVSVLGGTTIDLTTSGTDLRSCAVDSDGVYYTADASPDFPAQQYGSFLKRADKPAP